VTEWVESTAVGDLLLRSAERRPDHEALVFPESRFTWAELADRAVDSARSLAALGVGRGDHVGLLMPNCPDFVFSFFGAELLGAVVVPINSRFRTRELAYVIDNADLAVLLTSDIVDEHVDFVERLHESLPGLAGASDPLRLELASAPKLRTIVLLGEREPEGMLPRARFDELRAQVEPGHVLEQRARVRLRDLALMLFTSGTTAQPKGCLLTHEAIVRVWTSVSRVFQIDEDDRIWDPLPLFHMSALGPVLYCANLGATFMSMTHFEPGAALDQIERERATWIYSVFPPITMGLIKHPGFAERDLSRVRGLMTVGAPDTLRMVHDAFPQAGLVPGHFGMTECSGAITAMPWETPLDERIASTGPPLPGMEVRAADPETDEPLGPGERGELHVRGFGLFEGYYKDPALTAASFAEGGWLRSGDIGSIDERGSVTYIERHKDMLKVGGENVASAEIEEHLTTHAAIKLVQVVAAPDERLGEVPVAFVELAAGHELTEEEAIEFCRGAIAAFKVPRHVRFVSEWPMSATKIQKFRLREQIAAELAEREQVAS
jgi:fatty-acyl-CoA synthase